jgi:hypothetical protein
MSSSAAKRPSTSVSNSTSTSNTNGNPDNKRTRTSNRNAASTSNSSTSNSNGKKSSSSSSSGSGNNGVYSSEMYKNIKKFLQSKNTKLDFEWCKEDIKHEDEVCIIGFNFKGGVGKVRYVLLAVQIPRLINLT